MNVYSMLSEPDHHIISTELCIAQINELRELKDMMELAEVRIKDWV
jgi:hypothetical protein